MAMLIGWAQYRNGRFLVELVPLAALTLFFSFFRWARGSPITRIVL